MGLKDIYNDVLGSAGLSFRVVVRLFQAASLKRVFRILYDFVINGRIRNAAGRQKHKDAFIPKSIVIEPTYRCNMKCKDCYAPSDNTIMDRGMFSSIVEQAKALNIFRFELMGGEPTLPEVLDAVLPVIKENRNCLFTFCTNCIAVDQGFADKFRDISNVAFILSMEGTPDATESRRGKGSHANYTKAIQLLRKNKLPFALSVTLEPETWKEQIDEKIIADYVASGGVVVYSYPRFYTETGTFAALPHVEYLKQLQYLCKKFPVYWGDGHLGKMKGHKGIIPRHDNQVCINPSGIVRPYRFFLEPSFGSIKDSSFYSILSDKALVEFKKQARDKANSRLIAEKKILQDAGFEVYDYSWNQ